MSTWKDLETRRAQYLWRKLMGFCVSCRAFLKDSAEHVHCARCRRNQDAWQKANRDRRAASSRAYRARQKAKKLEAACASK